MPDYLNRLISRSFKQADAILPRPTVFFESRSPGDDQTFQQAPERDPSNEPHFHPERTAESPTSVSPKTRPAHTDIPPPGKKPNGLETSANVLPKTMDQPNDQKKPKTVLPKTRKPAVKPAVSPSTPEGMENKESPSIKDSKDTTAPGRPVHIAPTDQGLDHVNTGGGDLNFGYGDPVLKGNDMIPPPPASADAPSKATRTGHIEAPGRQSDARQVSSVHAEAGKVSVSAKEQPPPKRVNPDHDFSDRRGMKSIIVKPYVSAHVEQISMVPIKPTKGTKEHPSVNVTIGRVEVRAIMPEAPPVRRPRAAKPGPSLSLDDYLRQRNGEQR